MDTYTVKIQAFKVEDYFTTETITDTSEDVHGDFEAEALVRDKVESYKSQGFTLDSVHPHFRWASLSNYEGRNGTDVMIEVSPSVG